MRPVTASLWAAAATLGAPGLRLLLKLRLRRGKEIFGRLAERRGIDPTARPPGPLVWLHAASVGETVSALPVLAAVAAKAPELNMLVTTGTVTSAGLFLRRIPQLGLEDRVLHRFAPLDVPAWVGRFLEHWRPDAACFIESELWPNLLAACKRRKIPLMLMNARLSPKSFARWRRAPGLAKMLLESFARIDARSEADAERLRSLGAPAVDSPGDLKFAAPCLPVDTAELDRLRALLAGRPLWLAASTHPGEEASILDAHRRLAGRHPGLLTIIAPRHPERGRRITAELGGAWPLARRAAPADPPGETGLYVADTLGELGLWYRLAGIGFIGGSLVPHGGQNPLEAARLGCAIAAGPHMGNFAVAVDALERSGGLFRLSDAATLAGWVDAMLNNPARRQAMGAAAATASRGWADLPGRSADGLLALLHRRPA